MDFYVFAAPYLLNLRSSLLLVTVFAIGTIATSAQAQDAATGAIRGTVVDLHELRIPGASIALVNLATGLRYSTTTTPKDALPSIFSLPAITLPALSPRACLRR